MDQGELDVGQVWPAHFCPELIFLSRALSISSVTTLIP